MTLPTVTLTGTAYKPDGTPAAGERVVLALQARARDVDSTVFPVNLVITLDSNGTIPDATVVVPSDAFDPNPISYLVQPLFGGEEPFYVDIPTSDTPVDLFALLPLDVASAPVASYSTVEALTQEIAARTAGDAANASSIASNAAAITAETTNRSLAVSAEATARIAADTALASSVATETANRQAAITAEVTRANAAYDAAGAAVSAVAAEATARTAADTTNTNAITAETTRAQGVEALKADLVTGKVPTSQLPAIATFTTHTVASQAAMLALTAAVGDVAIRTDTTNARYLLTALPASTLGNWLLIDTDPTAGVDTVNGQHGTVVLGYADVGADAVGAAAAAQAAAATDATTKANAAQAASQPLDSDLTAIAAMDASVAGAIASDGSGWVKKSVAQFRTWLGLATVATSGTYSDLSGAPALGTASTHATGDFDAAGVAAAAVAAEKTRVDAAYTPVAPTRLFIVGHSISAGGGAPSEEQAWHNQLGGMLRAEVINYGRGGAVACWNESNQLPYGQTGDGGVGHVMSHMPLPALYRPYKGAYAAGTTYAARDVIWQSSSWYESLSDGNVGHDPSTDAGVHWAAMTGDIAHPYEPRGQLPVVFFGNNDLGWQGDLSAYLNSMRPILSMCLAAEVTVRATDVRVSYSGAGWGAALATGLGPGLGVSSGVTNGAKQLGSNTTDTETILTPADWPGGYICASYVVVAKSSTGIFRVQVDGATVLTKDISTDTVGQANATKSSGFGLRFQVAAGAHTIVIQQTTAITGTSGFAVYTDALILEATPAPPVIVPGLVKYLTTATYAALYGGGTTMTDATIDTWNTALQAFLAAEFPTAVYRALPITRDATLFYSDGIHPNAHGHALIASDLFTLITGTILPTVTAEQRAALARTPKTGRVARQIFGQDFPTAVIAVTVAAGWTDLSYTATKTGYTNGTRWVEVSISADPGDVIELSALGIWSNDASALSNVDFATITWPNGTSQTPVRNRYASSSGDTAQTLNGIPAGSLNAGVYAPVLPGSVYYRVRNDDLRLGQVTFRLIVKAAVATRNLLIGNQNPVHLAARNVGQEQFYEGELAAR